VRRGSGGGLDGSASEQEISNRNTKGSENGNGGGPRSPVNKYTRKMRCPRNWNAGREAGKSVYRRLFGKIVDGDA